MSLFFCLNLFSAFIIQFGWIIAFLNAITLYFPPFLLQREITGLNLIFGKASKVI